MSKEKSSSKPQEITFDPNVSSTNPYNRDVAKALGVQYDPKRKHYVDGDGCLTHDKFGQPL